MRTVLTSIFALALTTTALAGEVQFSAKPTATKAGDGLKIAFTVSAPTDVEVAVLGADGKVIRSLAAGVLGAKNPPPEPLKAGLTQEIVWDGKDDFGKPAAGAAKVRVRAGTGVKFGRMIGEDPYTFGFIDSIAADEDGSLYITVTGSDCNQSAQFLRVFGGDGRYLRTLIPFPADAKPEAVANLASWDAAKKAFTPRSYSSGNPSLYPVAGLRLISASKKAGIVMIAGTSVWRLDADGGNLKGPAAMWSPKASVKTGHNDPQLSVSPDGKYIYYSNVAGSQYDTKKASEIDPKWPNGRVYRQDTSKPGSDPEKFYDLELPENFWMPNAWNRRTAAYSTATDDKGHLHIGDLVNQEIVEVDGDGKKVGATKVAWPERVHVDSKSGAYYVLSRTTPLPNEKSDLKLIKITGRGAEAKVAGELALKTTVNRSGVGSCLGRMGDAPVLWIGSASGLTCVKDNGGKLEFAETGFKPVPEGQLDWGRIVVDAEREEIYTNNGVSKTYRYDGNTGKGGLLKKNGQPFWCVDMAVGYDGSLYMRTGDGFTGPLERYTRDLAPLPFATGSHQLWDIYSRYGIGFCDKGVGAGPKGESYISYMYDWNKYFVAGFGGDGKAIKGKFLDGKFKKPDPKSWVGKLPEERQVTNAVVGPIPASSGGIGVDLAGNIYVGMLLVPKGFIPPAGFEKDPAYANWTGSVVKFPPSGGTVLGAVQGDDQAAAEGPKIACEKGMTVVGGTAIYPGLAPFSGGGYGGNSSCCVCRVPRFHVDRFGRIVFTNVATYTATLVDNAGNKILDFGAYGNFDSQYVNPNTEAGKAGKPAVAGPEFPLAWPAGAGMSDKYIYVIDTYNKRVLRADKTFGAEEHCEVK
ncbi:MAG TPA: hypothetical protein PK280_20565 [Planctomycetota bacterium]|nr:hypothetical protein [Planctomycetota bacterium]